MELYENLAVVVYSIDSQAASEPTPKMVPESTISICTFTMA